MKVHDFPLTILFVKYIRPSLHGGPFVFPGILLPKMRQNRLLCNLLLLHVI